ncbi:MAG: DivIVA domain-containing protein, partial [Clostridia bacterium]|nr:DivIVA domain-containing protein [Clostridia bacterium]
MMTLEEIRHVEFTSGRGYRAEEVDDFIDECVETLEHYRKESEELNHKLKVLADKVAEYQRLDSQLVPYAEMQNITHVFFHSLIVDPARAFDSEYTNAGYNQYMTTIDEFVKMMEEMYA